MQNIGTFTGGQGKINTIWTKPEETSLKIGKAERCSSWSNGKHCFVKLYTILLILWLVEKLACFLATVKKGYLFFVCFFFFWQIVGKFVSVQQDMNKALCKEGSVPLLTAEWHVEYLPKVSQGCHHHFFIVKSYRFFLYLLPISPTSHNTPASSVI